MSTGIGRRNLRKILRDFFGGGSDLSVTNPLPVSDPKTLDTLTGLLVLKETGWTITTDGAEQDVYINNAPQGVFEPNIVKIDFTNQTAGETVVVRYYSRYRTGGGWIREDRKTFAGVQDPPGREVELDPNRFGVRVTMQRTAGVARDYDCEALYRG